MKILICSDGHAAAENAVRYIARTAGACAAEVTLLGIIEHPSDGPFLDDALRRAAGILRDRGVTVETATRQGRPLEEIRKRAAETPYDLVVIGAERREGEPLALSNKAYHIIKEVDPPVMVVIGDRRDLRRVLVCTAGGRAIQTAIELTAQISCRAELEVTLFHLMPEPPAIYGGIMEEEQNVDALLRSRSALGRNLLHEKETLEKLGVRVQVKLRVGIVPGGILEELEQGDYDLVVVGSAPGQGAVRTYMLGDVTSEIVNRSRTPVLVVRAERKDLQEGFFARVWRKAFG